MATLDRELRQKLLRPLVRREPRSIDFSAVVKAVERLDELAIGDEDVARLHEAALETRQKGSRSWKDPGRASKFVALAKALYLSRRISNQEYVFHAAMPVIHIHEGRWEDGAYDAELLPITRDLERIRSDYGLANGEDWPLGEGPIEYRHLNSEYNNVLDKKLISTLREYGLGDLADMKENTPTEFEVALERGRRSVFHRDEEALILKDIVVRYEREARNAAESKAYSAAITSLGAGVEGLLVLRCLRSPHKAARIANKLPRRLRPRHEHDPMSWTFETLIEACLRAGWLPPIKTPVAVYDSAGLAHRLRRMRNFVHPSRHARERPWIETDDREYADAAAIYVVLLTILGKVRRRKSGS